MGATGGVKIWLVLMAKEKKNTKTRTPFDEKRKKEARESELDEWNKAKQSGVRFVTGKREG